MGRCAALWGLLSAVSLAGGCVERRYVITSDPPAALVYRNGKPIGTTPVDDSYVYNGKYHFTLVKDGYETLQVQEDFGPRWYEYPPLDFFSENIWPFKIRDVRRPSYQLQPLQQVRHDDVLNRANELRVQGKLLVPFNPESVKRNAAVASTPPPLPPIVAPAPAPATTPVPPPAGFGTVPPSVTTQPPT